MIGGQDLKNIKKLTSLLDFPFKNWSTCKFVTLELECKTRNDNSFYLFFGKLGGNMRGDAPTAVR